ncbi:polyprenyl synthetase family protein [Sphaerochaeta pleomorpha]|nr:polyprenyl synthetase family protein [Sphaerochaeta pleomorpha]
MQHWLNQIETELNRIFPASFDQKWIDWMLDCSTLGADKNVFNHFCEPAKDLLARGGKRWRPLLMMLTAKMLGGEPALELAEKLVSLIEMPHNGTLIIDDIEDKSDLRRGKPAVHLMYGEDISINAGNLLYFLPTKAIDESLVEDTVKLRIYQIYAKYMRRVHLGQGMDISWHHDNTKTPTLEEYELMCRLKTGCLAAMGSEVGAALAVDDMNIIRKAGHIAETIGVGFQILDDVINLEKGNPGKRQGDDIVENKKSLPIILYANANPDQNEHLFSVFQFAQSSGYEKASDSIIALIKKIKDSGALEKAKGRAFELFGQAFDEIHELYPPSSERDFLIAMIKDFMTA